MFLFVLLGLCSYWLFWCCWNGNEQLLLELVLISAETRNYSCTEQAAVMPASHQRFYINSRS